jgi:hypothetical protein
MGVVGGDTAGRLRLLTAEPSLTNERKDVWKKDEGREVRRQSSASPKGGILPRPT